MDGNFPHMTSAAHGERAAAALVREIETHLGVTVKADELTNWLRHRFGTISVLAHTIHNAPVRQASAIFHTAFALDEGSGP